MANQKYHKIKKCFFQQILFNFVIIIYKYE